MADSPIFSDHDITHYLLGVLPEAETDRLEEQSICDPDFFERIEMAEEELIRQFLDRKLSRADETLFRSKYLAIPALNRKVEFAEGLRRVAQQELSRQSSRSTGTRWFAWPRVLFPVLASVGAVALAVAVVIFSGHTQQQVSSGQPLRDKQVSPGNAISLLLLPGVEKGASAHDRRLVIAPDTREIRLELEVPGSGAPPRADVDVMRVAAPNDEKRISQTVEGRSAGSGRLFTLTLTPDTLPEGSYIAYLRRWPASAHPEPEESFVFSVVR